MFYEDPTFWVLVSFVIFFALVWFKARDTITGMLDSRVDQIKDELEEARKLKDAAQAALSEQRRKNREAAEEAAAMLDRAKTEAVAQAELAHKKLKAQIELRKQQAMQRIAQAEEAAKAEIAERTVTLAMNASQKILEEQMKGDVGKSTIDTAITEVAKLAK